MASWTDQITQFTPYQSEEPIQALIDVGMAKQEQFNEGVRRVQGQVDYLANLPLVKQQHKEYMNAKLGELKKTVSTSIASDFSDQRLQNQIGGLTKQIGSDPVIQRGVQSTLVMMAEDDRMAKSKADGKSSVDNEAYYVNKRMKWLNDGDLNSNFNASYSDYIDLNKKSFEVIKALGADSSIEQNPYVKNPDGTINYGRVAAAMTEQGVKGIDATKIENAIRATLTPADENQLRISGWYRFQGQDRNSLINKFTQDYTADVAATASQIDKLKQAAKLASSDSKTSNYLNQIIKQKEALLGENGQLKQRLNSQIDAINNDPTDDLENVKGQLYKEGFIKEFSNAFSWEEKYLKYLTNPIQEQNNWQKDYALRQSTNARGWAEFNETVKQHGIENMFKAEELKAKLGPMVEPFVTQRETDTNIPTPTVAMRNEAATSEQQYNALLDKIASNMPVNGKPMNLNMLKQQIEAYKNGDKSKIPVNIRDDVNDAIAAKNNADFIGNVIKKTEEDVKNLPQFKQKEQDINNALQGRSQLNISVNGERISYTPRELLSYFSKERVSITQGSPTTGTGGSSSLYIDESSLTPKEKILYDKFRNTRYGTNPYADKDSKIINALSNSYKDIINTKKQNIEDINKAVEANLAPKAAKWNPYAVNWDAVKPEVRTQIEDVNAAVLERYKTGHAGAETLRGDDKDKLTEMIYGKNSEKTTYRPVFQGNQGYLEASNGDNRVLMPMTADEAIQVRNYVGIPDFNLALDERVQMGGLTTNPEDDPTKAQYNRGFFSPKNRINVTADAIGNSKNLSMKYPRLHVLTPQGWQSFTLESPMDNIHLEQYLRNITDQEIINQASKHLDPAIVQTIKTQK